MNTRIVCRGCTPAVLPGKYFFNNQIRIPGSWEFGLSLTKTNDPENVLTIVEKNKTDDYEPWNARRGSFFGKGEMMRGNYRKGYKKAEQKKRYGLYTHLTEEEREVLYRLADENGRSLSVTLALCLRYVAGLSEIERENIWYG